MIGRLAPGVSRQQAAAALNPLFQRAAYIGLGSPAAGEKSPTLSLEEARGFPGYSEEYGRPLRMLMAMVGFVLLIALTNVVMLLTARNAARQREFSMRLALGAGRRDLLRQLLAESLLLVASGGALAWVFAKMATRALASWAQIESSLAPDRTVLAFALGILVVAALLFGLAPLRIALAAGPALSLKTSAATSNADAGRSRGARIMVAFQMTLCVVLLVGAGLLIRTLAESREHPSRPACRRPRRLRSESACHLDSPGQGVLPGPDRQTARIARRGVRDCDGVAHWLMVVQQRRHDGRRTSARRPQWQFEDGAQQCCRPGLFYHSRCAGTCRTRLRRFRYRNLAACRHHQRAVREALLSQSESARPHDRHRDGRLPNDGRRQSSRITSTAA